MLMFLSCSIYAPSPLLSRTAVEMEELPEMRQSEIIRGLEAVHGIAAAQMKRALEEPREEPPSVNSSVTCGSEAEGEEEAGRISTTVQAMGANL